MTARYILFGDTCRPVCITDLAKKTGINRRTLTNRKRQPLSLTLGELRLIVKAEKLSDEDILKLFK